MQETNLTGYASIDKPWLKYYRNDVKCMKVPNMSMYEYAWNNNKDHLDDIIFDYYGKTISYGSFFENVENIAKTLNDMGITQGDVVTIVSMQTPETVELIYAINYLGAIANLAYMTISGKEIYDIIIKTNSKALFILNIVESKIDDIEFPNKFPVFVLSIADSMPKTLKLIMKIKNKESSKHSSFKCCLNSKEKILFKKGNGDDIAIIAYTSGTTGKPKGVMLTNNNLNSLVFQYHYTDIHFGRGETFLDILPIFLGYGIGMMTIAICNGLKIYLWLKPEAKDISKQFEKIKPNHIELGKAHVMQIINDWDSKQNLSFSINFAGGGDSISLEEEQKINDFLKRNGAKGRFVFGYGMTECASAVCTNSNTIYREGSLGVPLPLSVVKIENPDSKQELLYGQTGEICVCSPNLMRGYYMNEKATNDAISCDEAGNRWIRTGDLGYIDEDGFVYLTGRIKRIFLAKGKDQLIYKLFPQRIEELFVDKILEVKSCGVIAIKNEEQYYQAIAFVSLSTTNSRSQEDVLKKLYQLSSQELPEYSQPKRIIVIEKMPITSSGKIDYKELEKCVTDN